MSQDQDAFLKNGRAMQAKVKQRLAETPGVIAREKQISDAFTSDGEKFRFLEDMDEDAFRHEIMKAEIRGIEAQRQKDLKEIRFKCHTSFSKVKVGDIIAFAHPTNDKVKAFYPYTVVPNNPDKPYNLVRFALYDGSYIYQQNEDSWRRDGGYIIHSPSETVAAIDINSVVADIRKLPDNISSAGSSDTLTMTENELRLILERAQTTKAAEASTNRMSKTVSEPEIDKDQLADLLEGMEVSIDVNTCDEDAGNRLFGTVMVVQDCSGAKNGLILLVQEPEPNFKPKPPVMSEPVAWENKATRELQYAVPLYWDGSESESKPDPSYTPLFYMTGDVAALEARVRELEQELAKATKRRKRA